MLPTSNLSDHVAGSFQANEGEKKRKKLLEQVKCGFLSSFFKIIFHLSKTNIGHGRGVRILVIVNINKL